MEILTFVLGPLSTNCYLVINEKAKEVIIIDPADSGDFLTQKILENKLKLQAILATHGHFDHVLATLELKLNFKVPFLISQKDEFLLKLARKSANFWTKIDPQLESAKADRLLKEDDKIKLGNEELKVIDTPGHTPGGLCFYNKKSNILFSGDTIFKNAIGRTDLPYSSSADLQKSVEKLLKLPNSTIIYPGHGEKTTIEEFKEFKKGASI